jgi:hypothetical protein
MTDVPTWLHHFVLPLVAGGDVRVGGDPIDGQLLRQLRAAPLDDDPMARRIAEARHAVTAEILLDPPPPALHDDALCLAAAMHNLLFLCHPDARRWRRRAGVERFTVELATLDAPSSAVELADRHSLLHHLFDLGRDDVRVRFWAGRREFQGAEPPGRLYRWAKLRRVREERWRVLVVAQATAEAGRRALVEALLAASPLTDLLEPAREVPRLDLAPLCRWLQLPAIARAVADRYLEMGLERAGPPWAAALVALYGRSGVARAARLATQFLCHLQLLWLLGEARALEATRKIRMETLLAAHAGLRDFFGLFAAAARLGLSRPADLARDPQLGRLVDAHARLCATLAGDARVGELTGMMGRALALAA